MADSTALVLRTTEQQAAVFDPHGWTKTRVKWAKLDYRWDPNSQWQSLDKSYVFPGMEEMIEPWNVEQVEINGEGITVNQFGDSYSRLNDTKNEPVDETRYCWQVKFEYATCNSIVISERERRNPGVTAENLPLFVQIQFKCTMLPTSYDATVHKTEAEEGEAGDGEPEEGEAVEEAEMEMEEEEEGKEVEEGEVEEEEEILNPEEFPLAQLFRDRTDAKGLEIRLTFKRSGAGMKNPFRFVWPAVIHFLSGRQEQWNVTSKKKETEKLYGSIKLDKWLLENNKVRPSATFKETPNPDGGYFWALRPKPIPSQREKALAAQPASQQRRLAAPLPQYGQHATSAVPPPVPQFGAPLPSGRPEASSNKRELEDDTEARKMELYRQKVEQGKVEREAYRKWQEEVQKLKEVSEAFDELVISGSMNKKRRLE